MLKLLKSFKKSRSQMMPYKLQQAEAKPICSPLLAHRNNVASQDGEDGIIEKIFAVMPPKNRFCVEFGAWDGKYFSNTWNLLTHHSWSGLLIEGSPKKFRELTDNFKGNSAVRCLNQFVDFEGPNSLDDILARMDAPTEPDFISIDIDGADYFIWESLERFRPRVLVIEFNPSIPNDVLFVQPKSNAINQGCSLLALIQLGKEKGYELICCTGWNAFFVEKNNFDLFEIRDNAIDKLYTPVCDGRIFHGYDSYVYVTGMSRLIWSQTPVASQNFQVLPFSKRKFGDSQRG